MFWLPLSWKNVEIASQVEKFAASRNSLIKEFLDDSCMEPLVDALSRKEKKSTRANSVKRRKTVPLMPPISSSKPGDLFRSPSKINLDASIAIDDFALFSILPILCR